MGTPLQEGSLMNNHKITRAERRRAEREAKKLLRSPQFFNELLDALERDGLVGEKENAVVVYTGASSRIGPNPLNVFVSGQSSAGKNFLVKKVLRLLPRHAFVDVTSISDKAWSYMGDRLRHKVVYIPERNEDVGNVHPLRLLISEDKITRRVTSWKHGKLSTESYVARGPVASISTGTKQLKIDDATRHISISINETAEQTRRIAKSYTRQTKSLSEEEVRTWRMVQSLLEKKMGTEIDLPEWFDEVADRLPVRDLRVRRYFPAFIEACRTVCLIRSFRRDRKLSKQGHLEVEFADFAITALMFDHVFVESLHLGKGVGEATRRLVEEISAAKGRPVGAKDLKHKLGISIDQAYSKLRYAANVGVIRRANKSERTNRKLFLPVPRPRFIPHPEKMFKKLKDLKTKCRFVHPITGEWIEYWR
jgi:hypothetical protein